MTYKHGHASHHQSTPEYWVWIDMRRRCQNPGYKDYRHYGARGITVCDRWSDFEVFLADVGLRPAPDLTLDRIDVNGNYEPRNVRWANKAVQTRNRTSTKLTEATAAIIRAECAAGARQRDVAAKYGVCQQLISGIVRNKVWQLLP
jgi:hypothetical protein